MTMSPSRRQTDGTDEAEHRRSVLRRRAQKLRNAQRAGPDQERQVHIRRQTTAAINESGRLQITDPYVVDVLAEQEGLERDKVMRICHYRGPLRADRFHLNTPTELINIAVRGLEL